VDIAFVTQFSQALLQMESTLDTEETLEGSQHRVRRLFEFHDSLHTKHDIELIERSEQALTEVKLNNVEIPKDEEIQQKSQILETSVQGKVQRVLDLSEKFQMLYKLYEETISTKPTVQIELEQIVNELKEKLHNLEYQLYEKDEKLQTEVDSLTELKMKASKLERMYYKERKRKEILLKGVGLVPDDKNGENGDNSQKDDSVKKQKLPQDKDGENDTHSEEDDSEDDKSIEISSTDSDMKRKTENALKEIVSSSTPSNDDEASNEKRSDQIEETYVRFVDGFSHRLEAYEAEKLLTERQIDDLKAIVREKDEAMGDHMRKLERVVALKDQQLIQEREKFRKMFMQQLTREDQSVARLKAKLNSENESLSLGGRHQAKERKKSWADHRKQKLMRMDGRQSGRRGSSGKNSGRGSRKNSLAPSTTVSTPISPLSDSDDDLSSFRFGASAVGGPSRKNSIRPAGLQPFLQAAEKKMKEAAAKDGRNDVSLKLEDHMQDNEAAERKAKIEKKNKKLKKAYKKMQRKVEDITKRLEVYSVSSKPLDGVRPYGDSGPYGRVVLVFTDIQGSTNLWERSISDMTKALEVHNEIIRQTLKEVGGYEVKTEGDAFMIAMEGTFQALEFAMLVQVRLLQANWPDGLFNAPEGCMERDVHGAIMWRGVRVRMGMHIGEPIVMKDPTTNREDYFGPMVNKSARIEGCAQGGEVCVSDDFWKDVEHVFHNEDTRKKWTYPPWIRKVTTATLKGIPGRETVRSLLPEKLQNRNFPQAPAPNKQSNPSGSNDDVFSTVKELRKQVETLVRESESMKHDMQSNDFRKEITEKEEMIEFLSMEMLSQEREMQQLANLKESEINLLKEEIVNIRRSAEADAKRLNKIKEKEVKKKYQLNVTDIKQLNYQVKFMSRQKDTYQKKMKDLQYSLIEANDTIAELKQRMRRMKSDLKMQKMKVKKSKFFKGGPSASSVDDSLPRLGKPKRLLSASLSAPSINVAAADGADHEEGVRENATPRYMKHLTRRIKSDVKSWVNPLWQTVQGGDSESSNGGVTTSHEDRSEGAKRAPPLKMRKSKTMSAAPGFNRSLSNLA